eukprot:XP_011675254.1 PREDICTED: calcineurin-binding protein cabin-1 [Strongylocentrotus purpuratus]
MPIIRTLKETGNSYEAAKQRLLEATAHLEDDEGTVIATGVRVKAKRNRIISDSSSSSSSSSDDKRDDDDGDDDADDDDEDEEDIISQKRQRGRERKLLRNLEKEMKRKRTIVSISRPSLYKRTEMHSITPAKPKTKKPKSAMSMISALNDYGEDSDSDEESEVELTKEAQEEEAFSLYKKALEFQRSGDVQKAQETYKDLLQTRFLSKVEYEEEAFSLYKKALEFQRSGDVQKAQETYKDLLQTRFLSKVKASQEERRGGVTNTAITLKYSSYKNLGNLAMGKDDTDTAMENYLEAVSLDSTDVTLWYRIGTVAVKLSQLALARVAFEQGLRCSKFHWPCLDYLCTVLYAINDYVTCLYYIAQALEKDKRYTKGFALRDQMYSEQPCLRRDCLDLFKHCENDVFHYEVPKDKRQKIVDEALSLRYKRQELAKAPPLPRIKFLHPLTELKWKPLGERLVALYDHMTSKDPPMSLVTIIDLEDYKSKETASKAAKDVTPERAKMGPSPAPMDVDPSDQNKPAASPVSGSREGDQEDRQIPTDTPEHMGEQTPGQMGEEAKEAEEPQQADAEESMDVDVETVLDEKTKTEESKTTEPAESKTMTEDAGTSEQTLGSSALTLKQLAEAYLKSRGVQEEGTDLPGDAASASAVDMEKEQEPPDSTTAVLDSTPAMSDLPNMELQADSAAGSSQDSIQQSGRESTMGESSQDKTKIQPEDAVAMDAEDSQAEKSRRGQKRKRLLRDMPAPGKRRSARVRNTTVKKKEEEEIVNYTEVLRQFLPSTLLVSDDEEEDLQLKKSGDKDSKEIDVKRARESPVNERDSFGAMETDDVHSLLVECQVNNGIIDVMSRYLERLVAKHDLKWPDGLAAVYLDVYKRLRKHISLPELLCCDEDEIVVREMSMMCLLSAEFNLDQCLSAKTNGNTPAASPAMLGANTTTCTYKWGEHHEDDMMYLQELTLMQYMLPDLWPVIPARVYWLKARYYRQIGKTADGEDAFERCKEVLMREEERRKEDRQRAKKGKVEEEEMETDETDGANERRPAKVAVANIKHGALISIASITSEVESLQRCQSLEQLQRLHASGDHGKVVELLRPTIRHTPRPVRPENTPERCSQLLLLIQSQMELKDAKESIFCCVLGMVETWQGVQREGMQVFHQLWLETLNKTLTHLQKAFESCEISSLGVGGTGLLRKAVNVLIKIIEWTMYQADVNETTNATSVMPWVVLYHTIKYEEDHLAAKSLPSSDHEGEEGIHSPSTVPMLPSSLMLLENAHDYLGRQTWCCNCDGALLKLYIRVLSTELGKYSEDERHPFFSDLKHTLEQCFFCLYGHPTKKTKTRHLQDHGAIEVQLDWSNCCYIFDYFKPKIFPEFDSYKTSSMSAELEGLLLKISKVIPQDARPENALELVQGYVDGSNENAPAIPEGFIVLLQSFYLGQGILCYHFSFQYQTDTKSDGPIFKHGVAALRCFKRALEIDATNYALWIEYGSYAYILHSHASRQIKQKDQLKISDEDITSLSVKQAEMLEQAEHCFRQASTCEGEGDEEWLVHYMLGKVAEKRLLMEESLRHYLKAVIIFMQSESRDTRRRIPYLPHRTSRHEPLGEGLGTGSTVGASLETKDEGKVKDDAVTKKEKEAGEEPERMTEGETEGMTEGETEGETVVEVDEETKKRHLELINVCLGAMKLCLQRKAIKFYLHDLCVSPDRLDSWAGMALARVGRLDLKLNNSTDTKSDGPIFKHGVAALRCFKRALEIDATNYALWIEYGSYAYILHSHASRQIKQMYFRIHSAILKLVQCSLPGTKVKLDAYGTLEGLVQEAAQLPFVRAEEKKREPSSEPSTDTEQDARIRPPKPDTPPSLVPKRRGSPIYVATPQDHDYLHEKYRRSRSSQEEPTTDTASESDIFSGDESMSSFLSAQRSTITLRPVPARRALSAAEAQAVPTTPDGTPSIVGMGEDGKTRGEDGMSGGVSDAKQPEKDQPEGRTTTEDIVAPCQDPKLEIPAIVVSKPSPEAEAATEGSESPADKDNVSMTSAEAATESSESPAEKDNVSMTSAEAATESSESSADKDNVSKTSAEDRKEVTEKPDELRAEVDPTVASAPPDDGERGDPGQAVVMDTEDAEQPIPASKGEEINQDGRAKTDVQSPVAMEMDEADTADQNEAEESVDRNRGGIEETKEVLRRTLEGNISEEKMEIGLSGDIVEPEEGDEGGKRGNQENLEIIKGGGEDGGQGEVKEADNAEELTLLQKPSVDGSKEDKNKKAEVVDDADKFLPGEMEVDQGTVLAQGQMKAGVQKTQPKDIEKNQRKEEEPQDIAKEPMSLISDEKKEGEIAELGSKETLYSDAPTLESISQVGEIQEDLLVLPSLEKEVLPMVDTRSKEADSIMDEEMVDKSGADDAPPSNSTQSGTNDEKQIQGHKLDESKVESQKQSSHTVDGDLSEDGGSAEGVLHLDGGPDGKPKDGDSERVEQDSPAGDGKGHKGEVPEQEEMKVKDESEAAAQERAEVKMDTSIQGKGAAVQNKEDDTTKIPVITEGLGTGSNVGTSLEMKDEGKEKDDAVTKKEEEAGEEPGQMTEGKTDGETVVEVDEETKKRHLELINVCLGAMKLCLQRFPQHYKAAYRMAYLYAYAPTHKNLAWSKDILIGGSSGYPPKTPTDHIVAPGLFSEQHKSKNLFQGIWRNPIQDIDRSGSFPWHMYRSVALLVYILRELKDHILLLQVTSKLYRIPEQGKKYLRDADRLFLAREAFDSYRSTIRSRLVVSPSGTAEESLGLVLSSFRCYQYTQSKQPKLTSLASELLITAFKVLKGSSIESEPALLDQAARFCDHHISFNKLPRVSNCTVINFSTQSKC